MDRTGDYGDRLLDGYEFRQDNCLSGGFVDLCEGGTKTIGTPGGTVCVSPVGLWSGDKCSTLTGPQIVADTIDRAVARLDITSSFKLEQALWTGTPQQTAELACPDSVLASESADDITPVAGPLDVVPAFSLLLEELDDALQGARGVIHMPALALPYATFYGLVTRRDNRLQVANTDHLVIAGSGYPGTDPDGQAAAAGETWFYATGTVEYVLTSPFVPGGDDPASLIDRTVNTVEVRAERGAAAWFDPCAHLALNVCLPNPGPGCETS